jgi:hypothetical protein
VLVVVEGVGEWEESLQVGWGDRDWEDATVAVGEDAVETIHEVLEAFSRDGGCGSFWLRRSRMSLCRPRRGVDRSSWVVELDAFAVLCSSS